MESMNHGKNAPEISRNKFNKNAVATASEFLTETFAPQIERDMSDMIGRKVTVLMDPDDKEQCTVNFFYPHVFNTNYLRQEIRLEIGPLAEWVPSHPVTVSLTAAEQFPSAFKQADTLVPTVDVERTFWEKITILHAKPLDTIAPGLAESAALPRSHSTGNL